MSGAQSANTAEGGIGFSSIGLQDGLGSNLLRLLSAEDIVPGKPASYQLCKELYSYHTLGAKLVEAPINVAQSQERDITVPGGPESRLIPAFKAEWKRIGKIPGSQVAAGAGVIIHNLHRTARIYGIASLVVGAKGKSTAEPLDLANLAGEDIYFNVLDPLNTSGSLVLNQDPNASDYQRPTTLRVGKTEYHPSRAVIIMNEQPIYIEWTNSAFGFVGRSVYQRALYPMKTFLQSQITDQWITIKVGLLIAKMKMAGPVISNRIMQFFGFKRSALKAGVTGNVLTIGIEEAIESLNFQNLEGPAKFARENALKNIAMAAGMPSKLLEQEEMIGGMAEGTEDAKQIAMYINRMRIEMQPSYDFMDAIVRRRAWSPGFYKTIQKEMPDEYGKVPYETAFCQWENSFTATWPNLLQEPDSERLKSEEIRFKSAVAVYEVIAPNLDPPNKAAATAWLADEVNSRRDLFTSPLQIDEVALANYVPPTPAPEEKEPEPKPFASTT